jgi:hypothetical protein
VLGFTHKKTGTQEGTIMAQALPRVNFRTPFGSVSAPIGHHTAASHRTAPQSPAALQAYQAGYRAAYTARKQQPRHSAGVYLTACFGMLMVAMIILMGMTYAAIGLGIIPPTTATGSMPGSTPTISAPGVHLASHTTKKNG